MSENECGKTNYRSQRNSGLQDYYSGNFIKTNGKKGESEKKGKQQKKIRGG